MLFRLRSKAVFMRSQCSKIKEVQPEEDFQMQKIHEVEEQKSEG